MLTGSQINSCLRHHATPVHCLQGKVSGEHTAASEELQDKYQELQEEDASIKVCPEPAASILAQLAHPLSLEVTVSRTAAHFGSVARAHIAH